jgi:hypothetical protein
VHIELIVHVLQRDAARRSFELVTTPIAVYRGAVGPLVSLVFFFELHQQPYLFQTFLLFASPGRRRRSSSSGFVLM